jgi:hypothetical protein
VIFIYNRVTLELKFELAAIRRVQSKQNMAKPAQMSVASVQIGANLKKIFPLVTGV